MDQYRMRQAGEGDCSEIARIWVDGQATMGVPIRPDDYSGAFRDKVLNGDPIFQTWVAETPEGRILGWQSLSPYISHPYLRPYFAESSTYICPNSRARGLGRALLVYALEFATRTTLRYITANVLTSNTRILKITDDLGFARVGNFPAQIKEKVLPEMMLIVYPVPEPAGIRAVPDEDVRAFERQVGLVEPRITRASGNAAQHAPADLEPAAVARSKLSA